MNQGDWTDQTGKVTMQRKPVDVVAEVIIDGDKLTEREVIVLRAAVSATWEYWTRAGLKAGDADVLKYLQTINRLLGGEKRNGND